MADIFSDNFDTYADGQLTLNTFWVGDTQPVVQGVDYFSAPKAVKIPNAGGAFERNVYHVLDAMTAGYFAFYIKIGASASADGGFYLQDGVMIGLWVDFFNDGKIYVNKPDYPTALQTYEKNRWYRVVVQLKQEGEPFAIRVKIDNGSWSPWFWATDSMTEVNKLTLYGKPVDGDIFFDSIVVSAAEPLPTAEYTSQNWGMEAKSQVDDETIEQAIDRLIVVHESDPEAHLGAGESLQSHKAEAIIDHVAGSVLADKLSSSEGIYECTFESLDNWLTEGDISLDNWPGAFLAIVYGATNLSRLWAVMIDAENWLDYSKNILFQFVGWIGTAVNSKFTANLGALFSPTNIYGFGFQCVNGVVKGYWGKAGSLTFTSVLSVDESTTHVYRAYYDAFLQNVKFYIDGVYMATIENIGLPASSAGEVEFRADATAATDGEMHIKKVMVSRQA